MDFESLYLFQDQVLTLLRKVDTGFYLTGGTAASRGFLHHRYSEDLDFFVNDDSKFTLWADRIVARLSASSARQEDCEVIRWINAPDPDTFVTDLRRFG